MRTRRGFCYPREGTFLGNTSVKKKRDVTGGGDHFSFRKRQRFSPEFVGDRDLFDSLPDDLVISILSNLSSTALCPSDFVNILITYVLFLFNSFSLLSCKTKGLGEFQRTLCVNLICDRIFQAQDFIFMFFLSKIAP